MMTTWLAIRQVLFTGSVDWNKIVGTICIFLLLGPLGLGVLTLDVGDTDLRILADLTLALILFIDASAMSRPSWATLS